MAKKILLIEDEKMLAEMYKDKITQAGFDLSWAFTAEEGLVLVKKEEPDLIILDILLPEQNGIYFLQKMNEDPTIATIPVIAFSNLDDPDTKVEAFKLGVKDYIIKTSYTPQDIIDKIKTII